MIDEVAVIALLTAHFAAVAASGNTNGWNAVAGPAVLPGAEHGTAVSSDTIAVITGFPLINAPVAADEAARAGGPDTIVTGFQCAEGGTPVPIACVPVVALLRAAL